MPGQRRQLSIRMLKLHTPSKRLRLRIVAHIRQLKPDVVVTFDPIGGYRHPDHIHVHNATRLAFERASDPSFAPGSGSPFQPAALYFHVFPHRFLRIATRIMPFLGIDPRRFGRNHDIDLKALTEFEFPSPRSRKHRTCRSRQGGGRCLSRLAGRHANAARPDGSGHQN